MKDERLVSFPELVERVAQHRGWHMFDGRRTTDVDVPLSPSVLATLEEHGFSWQKAESRPGHFRMVDNANSPEVDHAVEHPFAEWELESSVLKFAVTIDIRPQLKPEPLIFTRPLFMADAGTASNQESHNRLYEVLVEYGPRKTAEFLQSILPFNAPMGLMFDEVGLNGYKCLGSLFEEFDGEERIIETLVRVNKIVLDPAPSASMLALPEAQREIKEGWRRQVLDTLAGVPGLRLGFSIVSTR